MSLESLGRSWVTECGMTALWLLAVVTTVVAVAQLRSLLRQRDRTTPSHDRQAALFWPLMTLATALVFWLLIAVVWLFNGLERGLRSPWVR